MRKLHSVALVLAAVPLMMGGCFSSSNSNNAASQQPPPPPPPVGFKALFQPLVGVFPYPRLPKPPKGANGRQARDVEPLEIRDGRRRFGSENGAAPEVSGGAPGRTRTSDARFRKLLRGPCGGPSRPERSSRVAEPGKACPDKSL